MARTFTYCPVNLGSLDSLAYQITLLEYVSLQLHSSRLEILLENINEIFGSDDLANLLKKKKNPHSPCSYDLTVVVDISFRLSLK